MKADEIDTICIEDLNKELENAKNAKNTTKIELLKHYLLNFILYSNLNEEEKSESPIKEKLLKIAILLEKLIQMEGKLTNIDVKRVADEKMIKKKSNHHDSKNVTPGKKFRVNSEKLKERTKPKEDFNIKTKNNTKNKK